MVSDRIAQSVDDGSRRGLVRSAWALLWGALCSLLLTPWYDALARWFPTARTSLKVLAAKVLTNQLVVAPGLNTLFFCYVVLTQVAPAFRMPAAKRALLGSKLRRELPATILRSCAYWACVQTLNFRLLPPQYATVCTMCASVVWSTYLAFVAHRS